MTTDPGRDDGAPARRGDPGAAGGRADLPPPRSFWSRLTPAEQDRLVAAGAPVVFPAGTVVYEENRPADRLMLIESGWAKVCVGQTGRERVLALRGPGDLLGERAVLLVRSRSATVVALGPVRALLLTAEQFGDFLDACPRAVAVLERQLYERTTELRGGPLTHGLGDAAHGLAYLLVDLIESRCGGDPADAVGFTLPVSHKDLADWAGVSRTAIAGVLTAWRARGLIHTARGRLTVADPAGLRAIRDAGFGVPSAEGLHEQQHEQGHERGHEREREWAEGTGGRDAGSRRFPGHGGVAARTDVRMPQSQPESARVLERQSWHGQNCSIMFTDIAGFGDAVRTDRDRDTVREIMYGLLVDAFANSGVPWSACYREDRGDGVLIVVPPSTPTAALIDPLLADLAAWLGRHNRLARDPVRIQLRVALHVGPVTHDGHGVGGESVITTARMLDAEVLKRELAATRADLGFITSQFVYDSVVKHRPGRVDPDTYRQVDVRVKQYEAVAWMHLKGRGALSASAMPMTAQGPRPPADVPPQGRRGPAPGEPAPAEPATGERAPGGRGGPVIGGDVHVQGDLVLGNKNEYY